MHVADLPARLLAPAPRVGAIALVCAALALLSACASLPFQGDHAGSTGPATVTGQVTSDRGAVLADVAIRLSGPSLRRSTRTDIAGRFTFDRVPMGRYTVSATSTGYKGTRQTVVVDKEGAVTVKLLLKM